MRIEPPTLELLDRDALAQELATLLDQPEAWARRPCRNCQIRCPCSASSDCTCMCAPECPNIAQVCSTDPKRYPLEPAIVPLVFELNALRLVQTCWSCEGHRDAGYRLTKRPQVWFYTRASCYAQLISDYLTGLRTEVLAHAWQVRLVSMGQRGCTTYSIEPVMDRPDASDLALLHHDLAVIAAGLSYRIRELASQALSALKHPRAAGSSQFARRRYI